MNRFARLSLIAALMTGFLVYLLGTYLDRRANSPEILIPVEGYDPRDILLGHYANIRTPLNRLDARRLDGDDGFQPGDRIWVTLETGPDGIARPVALHTSAPGSGTVVQGRVRSVRETPRPAHDESGNGDTRQLQSALWIDSSFNIERYYASQERARALQSRLRQGEATRDIGVYLILAIPADGAVLIKGFEIDGERQLDAIW